VASRIILIPLSPLPFVSSIRAGFTDSLGEYTIANVEPGQYFVLAIPFSGYAPAFYKAGAFGELHWKNADTVTVADAAVGGIDIGVVPIQTRGFAHFGGHVRSGGRGLGGVNVFAIDADGAVVGYALSNPDGSVSMEGLPSGSIGLVADKEEYNPASGSVDIAAGASTVTGSDLILSPTGTTSVPRQPDAPLNFSLDQNYPNPFNPSTRISFTLPIQSNVTLTVYNILGQVVATLENGSLTAGSHDAIWTGRDNEGRGVASGIYFYRLNAAGVNGQTFTSLRKMVFLK